jgi:phosphate transport system substrate-binding protein
MLTLDTLQKRLWPALAVAIAVGGAAACGSPNDTATDTDTTEGTEQAAIDEGAAGEEFDVRISGAGASFPAPLYQRWFSAINEEYPGLQVNYQSVGSGAGIEQYLSGTVDFGATDAPLTDEERQSFTEQYGMDPIQVPMTGGLVVFAYNLEGVDNLQLSNAAYCGIVTGEVTSWSDPTIAEANPDIDLPDQQINWVHRSDGSGTTFLFTNHINSACENWTAGAAKTIEWPTGIGAKGNEGIAAQVQQTQGAVGYVEYAYANENNISMATLENAAGNYIEPSPAAAASVFEGVEVPEDFALLIPNPEGEEAYPIAGLTWLLVYPEYESAETARAIQQVISWSLNNGDDIAQELGYIPLPSDVESRVVNTIEEEVTVAGVENKPVAQAEQ